MPFHQETRTVPYQPEQMFDLVADIMKYPDFIPWCDAMRMRRQNVIDGVGEMTADMLVSYKFFKERFTSHVELDRPALKLQAHFLDGPFKKLDTMWQFKAFSKPDKGHYDFERGTEIDFKIDFEFSSRLLQATAMQLFDKAFLKLSDAFIHRADEIYKISD